TGSFLTPWASSCLSSPTSRSTWRASSTAVTRTSTTMADSTRSPAFSPAIWINPPGPGVVASLGDRHQFEYVPVWVPKIETAPAAPIVELAVFKTPGCTAEDDIGFFDATKNGVEFAIRDVKSQMMTVEIGVIVEQ